MAASSLLNLKTRIRQQGNLATSGVNLTKFTFKRKGVLKSVPENHRKDGIRNIDLDGKLEKKGHQGSTGILKEIIQVPN